MGEITFFQAHGVHIGCAAPFNALGTRSTGFLKVFQRGFSETCRPVPSQPLSEGRIDDRSETIGATSKKTVQARLEMLLARFPVPTGVHQRRPSRGLLVLHRRLRHGSRTLQLLGFRVTSACRVTTRYAPAKCMHVRITTQPIRQRCMAKELQCGRGMASRHADARGTICVRLYMCPCLPCQAKKLYLTKALRRAHSAYLLA